MSYRCWTACWARWTRLPLAACTAWTPAWPRSKICYPTATTFWAQVGDTKADMQTAAAMCCSASRLEGASGTDGPAAVGVPRPELGLVLSRSHWGSFALPVLLQAL